MNADVPQIEPPAACSLMKAVVTGATGFLGRDRHAPARERGDEVRVTYRNPERPKHLRGLDVRRAKVDVLDFRAMRGRRGARRALRHRRLRRLEPRRAVRRMNAHAPVVAVEAAAAQGLERVGITSTISATGWRRRPPGERGDGVPARLAGLAHPDSKHEGELAALEAGERHGIEVVVVNPAYLLGVPPTASSRARPRPARSATTSVAGRRASWTRR